MIGTERENHMVSGFHGIITQLEQQKAAIEKALEALHSLNGNAPVEAAAPSRKGGMSPEGKRRLIAALKRRWAAKKAPAAAVASVPAPARRKRRGMTPEGRKRLAEAMRRRWAAKRKAA
jgi:hypothetical protein